MPGNRPYEAFSAFAEPLANALKCVCTTKILTTPGGKSQLGRVHALMLTGEANDGYVRLNGSARLELMGRMRYQIIEDSRPGYGKYRVTTRAYDYSIQTADKSRIIDFHWHPAGTSCVPWPHCHVGTSQLKPDAVLTRKIHLPTARITLESTIRLAIEFGTEPLTVDWDATLAASEGPHLQHRSWHKDFEVETGQKIGR